jgi:hypothetical protein
MRTKRCERRGGAPVERHELVVAWEIVVIVVARGPARQVEHAVDTVVVELMRGHEVEVASNAVGRERLLLPYCYEQRAT